MERRIGPSERLEEAIEDLLGEGFTDPVKLAQLGRLGAQLVIQRGVDAEVATFLQRARYERTPAARGSRNGVRPRRVQTAEGELEISMPQLRNCAEKFVCRVIPDTRTIIRTRPPAGAGHWGLRTRALRPGHREPAQGGRAGQGLQE